MWESPSSSSRLPVVPVSVSAAAAHPVPSGALALTLATLTSAPAQSTALMAPTVHANEIWRYITKCRQLMVWVLSDDDNAELRGAMFPALSNTPVSVAEIKQLAHLYHNVVLDVCPWIVHSRSYLHVLIDEHESFEHLAQAVDAAIIEACRGGSSAVSTPQGTPRASWHRRSVAEVVSNHSGKADGRSSSIQSRKRAARAATTQTTCAPTRHGRPTVRRQGSPSRPGSRSARRRSRRSADPATAATRSARRTTRTRFRFPSRSRGRRCSSGSRRASASPFAARSRSCRPPRPSLPRQSLKKSRLSSPKQMQTSPSSSSPPQSRSKSTPRRSCPSPARPTSRRPRQRSRSRRPSLRRLFQVGQDIPMRLPPTPSHTVVFATFPARDPSPTTGGSCTDAERRRIPRIEVTPPTAMAEFFDVGVEAVYPEYLSLRDTRARVTLEDVDEEEEPAVEEAHAAAGLDLGFLLHIVHALWISAFLYRLVRM